MKKLVFVLAISLVLAMSVMAYAQGHGMMGEGPGMGHGMGMMGGEQHLLKKLMSLGLDDQQAKAIKEIVRASQKETIQKKADLAIARLDLKDLLDTYPADMTAVEAKLKQIGSLKTDIELSHIKTLEAVKAKLTPDQRKKLKDMRSHGMMGKMGMMNRKGCPMMGNMKGGMMGDMKGGMMQQMHHEKMGTAPQSSGDDEGMETAPQSSDTDEEMPEMEMGN